MLLVIRSFYSCLLGVPIFIMHIYIEDVSYWLGILLIVYTRSPAIYYSSTRIWAVVNNSKPRPILDGITYRLEA